MGIWIAVTTIYGWVMHVRGQKQGALDIVDVQHKAGVFKDKIKMYRKIVKYIEAKAAEEEEG